MKKILLLSGLYLLISIVNLNASSFTSGGGGSGTTENTFETVDVPAGTDPVAETSTDTLTITETSPLVFTGTAGTDTIDITVDAGADFDSSGLIEANSVALTTDTTGNYAAGDAEAGSALTGDSATAFFSTGILEVGIGGTGATTLTDGGILLGSGTGAITALGVATNGQIPIGDGTTDPVLATLTDGASSGIDVTNGAGTIEVTFDGTELNTLALGNGTFTTLTFDAGVTDPVLTASGTGTLNLSTGSLQEGGNNVPNASDNLSFFSATTSAQLAGVLSDETGSGASVFGTSPTFTTGTTTNGTVSVVESNSTVQYGRSNQSLGISTTDAYGGMVLTTWSVADRAPTVDIQVSRSNTAGTHAVVANGNTLTQWDFRGSDGSQFLTAASFQAYVDNTPGTNDMPGRFAFYTTADGASGVTERMRINSGGNVIVGSTGTDLSAHLSVDGDEDEVQLLVQGNATQTTNLAVFETSAGTDIVTVKNAGSLHFEPLASAPASPAAGDMYMDSTPSPDELCVYDGTGWQALITGTDANCA